MDKESVNKELLNKFEKRLPTLYKMSQSDPRFDHLSENDIRDRWLSISDGEKKGILLIGALQEFIWVNIENSSVNVNDIIDEEIRKKGGGKSEFGTYTKKLIDTFERMKEEGKIYDYHYVSQSGRTELDAALDELGVDWIIEPQKESYHLIQQFPKISSMGDRYRKMIDVYGEKFSIKPFIGPMPVRDLDKKIPDDQTLEAWVLYGILNSKPFSPNVLKDAFQQRPRNWYNFRD